MKNNIKPSNRTHGGKNALNLLNKDKIKDFSVSINPYGPPPEVKLSIDHTLVKEYPDPESKELKKLIASLNKIKKKISLSEMVLPKLLHCFSFVL